MELNIKENPVYLSLLRQYTKNKILYPLKISWDITSQCNLNCFYCYKKYDLNKKELSIKELFYIVEQIKKIKPLEVTLGGGEPFLREEILDIIKSLKKADIWVYILTNGTLLTENLIKRLSNILRETDIIQISVDFLYHKQNKKTLKAKYFERKKLESLLKIIKKYNLKVYVNLTPTKYNYKEIIKIFSLCEEIGIQGFGCTPLVPLGGANLNLKVQPEALIKIEDELKNIPVKNCSYLGGITTIYDFIEVKKNNKNAKVKKIKNKVKNILSCTAGRYQLHIDESGNIYPCVFCMNKIYKVGNIFEKDLEYLWNNGDWGIFREGQDLSDTECESCLYFKDCLGGCPGISYNYYKKINKPDPRCPFNRNEKNNKRF